VHGEKAEARWVKNVQPTSATSKCIHLFCIHLYAEVIKNGLVAMSLLTKLLPCVTVTAPTGNLSGLIGALGAAAGGRNSK